MIRFALFGHPVGHSLSPVMHAASFRSLGLEASYRCFDIAPEDLAAALDARRSEGYLGLNLTVPHKVAAVPLMDSLDASARLFGAVNTVRFESDGTRTGFNTDAEGFLQDLQARAGAAPEGRRVMIVGCGGAGRALAIGCAAAGAAALALVNRTFSRACAVAAEIRGKFPAVRVDALPLDGKAEEEARSCDIIVQCTTAGLRPDDPTALPAEAFREGQILYDIVYTEPVTPTMAAARAAGAAAYNGIGMLARQGAAAFKIWTGREADVDAMTAALEGR